VRRIIRALEITERSGATASQLRREHGFGDRPYRTLHLALDPGRDEVDRRIGRRCARMIEAGLLREVRHLRERGYGPELPAMQAIGYRHMAPVVEGRETLANAQVAMERDTRRFARRQRTWLRGVPEAIWIAPSEGARLLRLVEDFLGAGDRAATRGRTPRI
jgi:tRNA dimethylallyltransferase